MLIVAYERDGVTLRHTVPQGHAVTAEYNCEFLRTHLRAALRRRRRHFLNNSPIILQDNARPHPAGVFQLLGEMLYHPSYSPDISPCGCILIPKIKSPLQGIRFRTVNDVLHITDCSLLNLQRLGGTLNGMQRLPHRWGRVLHNGGDYFEGL